MERSKGSTRKAKRIKYLHQDQVVALFHAAEGRSLRDHLLLAFLYRFGLRASEACGLRTDDVDAKRGQVRVQGLKGGLERLYTLPRDLLRLVRRHEPGERYFFASRENERSERLSRTRVWQIYREAADEAGIPRGGKDDPGYGVHSLRHSAAVHALDAGLQLEDVQDLLRHSRMSSTKVYGEISVRRRNDYLRRLEESDAIVKVKR